MENRQRLMILGIGVTMIGVLATARPVDAQSKEARGTITAVTDSTLTIKAGAQDMTFVVDSRTHLEVRTAEWHATGVSCGKQDAVQIGARNRN